MKTFDNCLFSCVISNTNSLSTGYRLITLNQLCSDELLHDILNVSHPPVTVAVGSTHCAASNCVSGEDPLGHPRSAAEVMQSFPATSPSAEL